MSTENSEPEEVKPVAEEAATEATPTPVKEAAAEKIPAPVKVAATEAIPAPVKEAAAEKIPAPVKEAATEAIPAPVKEAAPKAKAEEAPKKEAKAEEAAPAKEGEEASEGGEKKGKTSAIDDLLKDELEGVKIRRAKSSKNITNGVVHVVATFNNTKVSVTDTKGNVISWSSAGKCNFRGSRKSTAYAAQVVTQDATRAAMAHGLKEVEVHLKGPGMGRDSAVRALQALGLHISAIIDKTPVPHNGCRPPKRRRV